MNVIIKKYEENHLKAMIEIWNEVVTDGIAFPQDVCLTDEDGAAFFAQQTHCGVAINSETDEVLGLYILHPNNIGRCGHICNASYAVRSDLRGLHIGEKLVSDCLKTAPRYGYRVLQFNAVVKTNSSARHLYEKLGFEQLGTITGGFRMPDGHYEDICPYFISLV